MLLLRSCRRYHQLTEHRYAGWHGILPIAAACLYQRWKRAPLRGDAISFEFSASHCSYYLPPPTALTTLPAFLRTTSSIYLIPLPLYGSGFLSARIFAANSPTICLSMPLIVMIFFSTVTLNPSGIFTSTGCEKPKLKFMFFPAIEAL